MSLTIVTLETTSEFRVGEHTIRVTTEPAPTAAPDHGALAGLGDDDHPHYLTADRGDAAYAPISHTSDTDNPHATTAAQVGAADALHDHDAAYAPLVNGVTNGDSHDHNGGDGGQIAYANLSGLPTLGTAAAKNIPASGNASETEVVYGSDTRLSDQRAPIAHTHGNISDGGTIGSTADLPVKTTTGGALATGLWGSAAGTFCQGNDLRLSDQRTPTAHAHSAADLASGTVADARLPARLSTAAKQITDWNSATETGWYMGNAAANSPSGLAVWFLGTVVAHNYLWVTQTVHVFTDDSASDTKSWTRSSYDNGSGVIAWGAWYKLQLSQTEQDARYALLTSLGTAATYNTGTSGSTVPLLSGANTWGAAQYLQLGAQGTPSLAFTGDTNTGLWSPAADTIAVSTGGTERVRFDANGRIFTGHTSALSASTVAPKMAINTTSIFDGGFSGMHWEANSNAQVVYNAKSRGATVGDYTAVQVNDVLYDHRMHGSNGSGFVEAARIAVFVDAEPTTAGDTTDMPGRFSFFTTSDGSGAPTEKMTIKHNGNVMIGTTTDDGVSKLQVNGNVTIVPPASATPASNGQMTFELTNNTTLKIKVKGSDGVVRSTTLTLA